MMEYKFRVWDRNKRAMNLSPNEIDHLGSWFDAHFPGSLSDIDSKVIMQYIGKQDIKNQDMFEKDIVIVNSTSFRGHLFVINWWDIECCFGLDGITNEEMHLTFEDPDTYLKIGNAFDNPELLEA